MNNTNWSRCRRGRACPICNRLDWCMVAADGSAVLCARIESNHPAGNRGAGCIHRLDKHRAILQPWTLPRRPKPKPAFDWTALSKAHVKAMTTARWTQLSATVEITIPTLQQMRWGFSTRLNCWKVPMRDGTGNIIGIRTRNLDGSKRAITGSRSGLYFAPSALNSDCLIITEGPTDASALIDAGFCGVVGRPSCRGGAHLIIDLISKAKPVAAFLVPDRDQPGIDGAARLAEAVVNSGLLSHTRIGAVLPPNDVKDCRDWYIKNPDHLSKIIGAEIRKLTQIFTEGTR